MFNCGHESACGKYDHDPAEINDLSDTTVDGTRTVIFRLNSPRNAAQLDAKIAGQGEITAAAIGGRPLDLAAYASARDSTLQFGYSGVDDSGVEVSLTLRSAAPVNVAIIEMTYGLPEIPGMTIQFRLAEYIPATGMPLNAAGVQNAFTI